MFYDQEHTMTEKTPNRINKDLILREKLALQRTVLANQTTLLSFLRTAMYFLVAGLSVKNLLKVNNSLPFEVLFYVIAGFILVFGTINYVRQKKKINDSKRHIGSYQDDYLKE